MHPSRRCIFGEDSDRSAGRCEKVDRSASHIYNIRSSSSGDSSADKFLSSYVVDLSDHRVVQCGFSSNQVGCHCAVRHILRPFHIFVESSPAH